MKTIKNKLILKEFHNYVKEFFGIMYSVETGLKLTFRQWCICLKNTELEKNK